VLIFTEGAKTETSYLTSWSRRYSTKVRVSVDDFHGAPLQLVEHAVAIRIADRKAERKGKGRAWDQIWCMFDTDEHAHMNDAFQLAVAHDIGIALSNPCVELWFILHLQDYRAYVERDVIKALAHTRLGWQGQALSSAVCDVLTNAYPDAKERASDLQAWHIGNGSPSTENPSSGVWQLIDQVYLS
jgi:hypothetical protein